MDEFATNLLGLIDRESKEAYIVENRRLLEVRLNLPTYSNFLKQTMNSMNFLIIDSDKNVKKDVIAVTSTVFGSVKVIPDKKVPDGIVVFCFGEPASFPGGVGAIALKNISLIKKKGRRIEVGEW